MPSEHAYQPLCQRFVCPWTREASGLSPHSHHCQNCWSVVVSGRWSEGELKKLSSDASFSVPSALRAGVSDSILNGKSRRQMSCWCRKSNKVWKTADAADQWFWTPIFEGLPWGINNFYTVVLHIKLQKKYQQKVQFEPGSQNFGNCRTENWTDSPITMDWTGLNLNRQFGSFGSRFLHQFRTELWHH